MSPVYERGYRDWDGERTPGWMRVATIAGEGLRAAVRSKWVWLLLTATAIHVAIRGGVLYFTGQVQAPAGNVPPNVEDQIRFTETFMSSAMGFQARWVLMVLLALVASPSIARDLKAGALSFYFSKPITRVGYAIGKLAPAFLLGLTVTVLPGLILWTLGYAFTPSTLHPETVASMPGRILLAGTLVSLVASLVVVALSGLVRSTNIAAAGWVALALLSAGASQLIGALTGVNWAQLVDVFTAFNLSAASILDATSAADPTSGAWLVTLGWAAASVAGIAYVLNEQEVTG